MSPQGMTLGDNVKGYEWGAETQDLDGYDGIEEELEAKTERGRWGTGWREQEAGTKPTVKRLRASRGSGLRDMLQGPLARAVEFALGQKSVQNRANCDRNLQPKGPQIA